MKFKRVVRILDSDLEERLGLYLGRDSEYGYYFYYDGCFNQISFENVRQIEFIGFGFFNY